MRTTTGRNNHVRNLPEKKRFSRKKRANLKQAFHPRPVGTVHAGLPPSSMRTSSPPVSSPQPKISAPRRLHGSGGGDNGFQRRSDRGALVRVDSSEVLQKSASLLAATCASKQFGEVSSGFDIARKNIHRDAIRLLGL